MDVARINLSHGDWDTHKRIIARIRRVAQEEGQLVSILVDLQGPKLRVGDLPDEGINLAPGQEVTLRTDADTSGTEVPVPHPELLAALQQGQHVLLDDGTLELTVVESGAETVQCRVVIGGRLTSNKGINVPDTDLTLPALTEKDHADVQVAVEQQVDFIALSFVRRPHDVQQLRDIVIDSGADIAIIAKIEKPEALVVFDDILAQADGIMVARGDLGVETPAAEVPFHQKRIIRACNGAGKPVITATQMLQSMIDHPRPTRAEASDVANAILDGTDAVMLSGETAVGRYPVETTRTMDVICETAERHLSNGTHLRASVRMQETVTSAISYAAVRIVGEVDARAIVTATMSGTTARMVARHRPSVPVIALTPSLTTLRRLALSWGVFPVLVDEFSTTDEMIRLMVHTVHQQGIVDRGDLLVLTAGIPFGRGKKTNLLKVHRLGESEWV